MKNKQLSKLIKFDTPTICNGLELIDSKFKLRGYSKEKFFCLNPKIKPMVGYAKTAKISSVKHNIKTKSSIRVDYYEYVNEGNFPKISVDVPCPFSSIIFTPIRASFVLLSMIVP